MTWSLLPPPASDRAAPTQHGASARPTAPAAPTLGVRDATPAEREHWDQLLAHFDNRQLAHTAAWVRSLESSRLGSPLLLVLERGSRVVACLPGLLTRRGPIRIFGSPLPGWQTAAMGPAFDANEVTTAAMMERFVSHLETRHGVHHVEMISSALDHDAMRACGFRGEPVPTFRCRLYRDEGRQLKALKDSARRNIRRATRLGIEVRFADDERFVDEHFDQIQEVFRRGGNAVPFRKERVLSFFRHMRASGNLLATAAYVRDESGAEVCIATGMFTIERNELALWTWTHRTRYRWYRPTELMAWTVMRRAAAAGCDTFDMMGRGDFKSRFGAELEAANYRWVRSRYRWLTVLRDVAGVAYRRQQSLRGRLARSREQLLERLTARPGGGGPPGTEEAAE